MLNRFLAFLVTLNHFNAPATSGPTTRTLVTCRAAI